MWPAAGKVDIGAYEWQPVVTGVSPSPGPVSGGTPVLITGVHLSGATGVIFGTTAGTNVAALSPTTVMATIPAASQPGTVDVKVVVPNGPSAVSPNDVFTYSSNPSTLGGVSGRVWNDTNSNGTEDPGEPGIAGAAVEIYSSTGTLCGTAVTDASGDYSFAGLPAGSYYEVVRAPIGYTSFTTEDVSANPAINSDVDATGTTAVLTIAAGQTTANVNAGLIGSEPGFGWALSLANINAYYSDNTPALAQLVTTDAEGDVYVAGSIDGTFNFDRGLGTYDVTATGPGTFVAKYTSAGALLWAKGFTGSMEGTDWSSMDAIAVVPTAACTAPAPSPARSISAPPPSLPKAIRMCWSSSSTRPAISSG